MRPAPKVLSGAACHGVEFEHLLVGVCSADIDTGEAALGQPGNVGSPLIGRLKEERQSRPQFSLQSTAGQRSLPGGLGSPFVLSGYSAKLSSAVNRGITHFHDNLGSELSREDEEHEPEEYLSTMSVHF